MIFNTLWLLSFCLPLRLKKCALRTSNGWLVGRLNDQSPGLKKIVKCLWMATISVKWINSCNIKNQKTKGFYKYILSHMWIIIGWCVQSLLQPIIVWACIAVSLLVFKSFISWYISQEFQCGLADVEPCSGYTWYSLSAMFQKLGMNLGQQVTVVCINNEPTNLVNVYMAGIPIFFSQHTQ